MARSKSFFYYPLLFYLANGPSAKRELVCSLTASQELRREKDERHQLTAPETADYRSAQQMREGRSIDRRPSSFYGSDTNEDARSCKVV